MTINQPLITIGITCFNAENTIERAINSALFQKWDNKEILIVDDYSNDSSTLKIQEIIANQPICKLINHEKNMGPAAARQTLLDHARGECIAFFDDDDESLPNRLKLQYQKIINFENLNNLSLIACYASGERHYKKYKMDLKAIGSEEIVPYGTDVADRLLFFGGNKDFYYGTGTPSCSLMARKSTFDHINGFDKNFRRVEDVDFAIRLALAGGYFIGTKEKLFIQHSTEALDKSPEKNRDAEIALAEKHKTYLCSVGKYYYSKRWPMLRYYHFKRNYLYMLVTLLQLFIRHPFKTASHFLKSMPRRFFHELRIKAGLQK